MGGPRFVAAIPFWLYLIGALIVGILWTGVIIALGVLLVVAAIIYLLIALFIAIFRVIRESNDVRKSRD